MDGEDRQDAEFRVAVLMDQIGDLSRHVSHDPDLNPSTRPIDRDPDTRKHLETEAYGDALWQLFCLMEIRDISLEDAVESALERMETREGYEQQNEVTLQGQVAHPGHDDLLTGTVGDNVYVTEEFSPGDATISDYRLILTEYGGVTCHAATIARERDIPAVVGVKDLTENVQDGDSVSVDMTVGEVTVL